VPERLAELGVFEALLDVSPVGGYVRWGLLGVGLPRKEGDRDGGLLRISSASAD
jgi:hypothetical protein